jgi:thiol-disulfide isomerase/thioredoxin
LARLFKRWNRGSDRTDASEARIAGCGLSHVLWPVDPVQPDGTLLTHRNHGIPAGDSFPTRTFDWIDGSEHHDLAHGGGTVVVITSPGCGACKMLYPDLPRFAKEHPDIRIVSLMLGSRESVRSIVDEYGLQLPVAAIDHDDLSMLRTEIFPFAYLLSPDGKVMAKGATMNEEHLKILVSELTIKKNKKIYEKRKQSGVAI